MLAAILAQGAGGEATSDPITALIGGAGVAGIWLVTIILGWMHPNTAMKREIDRADRAEARVDELTDVYVKEVIPALAASTAAVLDADQRASGG